MAYVAVAALVIGVIAAGVQAYSQYKQSQQQAAVYKYNAQVAKNNATSARNAASVEEYQVREKNKRVMATARARYAKGNVVLSLGSPLEVMAANARQAELDAQIVRYRGELGAVGYESQASLLKQQSKSIRQAGVISATSTLLSGAASAAGGYASLPSSGVIGANAGSQIMEG